MNSNSNVDVNKYTADEDSIKELRKKFDAFYAVTDDKFKKEEFEKKVNSETVIWQRPETKYWKDFLKSLILRHIEETSSINAKKIFDNLI